jgi:16S rRNA (cytosine967-C5)-methyltransferase
MAARALKRVIDEGAYSQRAIDSELRMTLDRREGRLATALVYGVLTWRTRIDAVLAHCLRNGLRSLPPTATHRLRIALYERGWMGDRIPESASVNEAVNAIKTEWGPKLGGLANGVLRRIIRENLTPGSPSDDELATLQGAAIGEAWGLTPWIAHLLQERLVADDPASADAQMSAIARAWTEVSHVHLRQRGERPAFPAPPADGDPGQQDAIEAELIPHPRVPNAWIVASGFAPGQFGYEDWSIQDAGSQLVALLVPPDTEGTILDVCAGLGVKTRQLADLFPSATLVRTDRDPRKLQQQSLPGFAAAWELPLPAPATVVDHAPYAAVLVDAPCSGLGTVGRHPEVKFNRELSDVASLAALQTSILDTASTLVAPGGVLVYAVCTWTLAEGPDVVEAFLRTHPEFKLDVPAGRIGGSEMSWEGLVDRRGMVALMPDVAPWDGFFMARMTRSPSSEESA